MTQEEYIQSGNGTEFKISQIKKFKIIHFCTTYVFFLNFVTAYEVRNCSLGNKLTVSLCLQEVNRLLLVIEVAV